MNGIRSTLLLEQRRRNRERFAFRYVPRPTNQQIIDRMAVRAFNENGNQRRNRNSGHPDFHREKGVLWMLLASVATILLVFQLTSVCNEYMKYESETDVSYTEPEHVSIPGVSICFDPTELVNITKMDELYPNSSNIPDNLSIGDIFDLTPSNDTIIKSCRYKTNDSFSLHSKDIEDCLKRYSIKKYQKLHKLCYDIRSRKYWLYLVNRVKQGLEEPGTFESFHMDIDKFKNVTSFNLVITNHATEPRGSNLFPSYVSRNGQDYLIVSMKNRSLVMDVDSLSNDSEPVYHIDKTVESSQLKLNEFTFTFAIYVNWFQPPPYSNCFDYVSHKESRFRSKDHCKDICLYYSVANISNKLPDKVLITEDNVRSKVVDGTRKIVSKSDYTNTTLMKFFAEFEKVCSEKCRPECIDKFYETRSMDSETSNDFTIKLFSYHTLPFYTHYYPRIIFSQFLIQFLSCFGIWLTIDFTTLISFYVKIDQFFRSRITNE